MAQTEDWNRTKEVSNECVCFDSTLDEGTKRGGMVSTLIPKVLRMTVNVLHRES